MVRPRFGEELLTEVVKVRLSPEDVACLEESAGDRTKSATIRDLIRESCADSV